MKNEIERLATAIRPYANGDGNDDMPLAADISQANAMKLLLCLDEIIEEEEEPEDYS